LCVAIKGTVPFLPSPVSPDSKRNASFSFAYSKEVGASPTTTLSKGAVEGGKSVTAEGERRYKGLPKSDVAVSYDSSWLAKSDRKLNSLEVALSDEISNG